MEHSQLLQILLAFVISAASAWGGAKYAIKYLEKTTDNLTRTIQTIQCDMRNYARIEQCRDSKINCKTDKVANIKEITDKIDKLSMEVIDQNRRREDAKDENQRLYSEINARLARLEARIESLMETK